MSCRGGRLCPPVGQCPICCGVSQKTVVRHTGRARHRPLQADRVFASVDSFLWVRRAGRTEASAPTGAYRSTLVQSNFRHCAARAGQARPYVTTNWGGTEKITPARDSRGRGVAGFCFTSTGLPADREWLPFGRGWRCFWGGGRRLHRSAALRRTPTAWRGRRSRKCSWHHDSSGCSCPHRR